MSGLMGRSGIDIEKAMELAENKNKKQLKRAAEGCASKGNIKGGKWKMGIWVEDKD